MNFRLFAKQAISLAFVFVLPGFDCNAQVRDEVFLFEDVRNPKGLTQTDCSAKEDAVWVQVQWAERGLFGRSVT